jgi:acetyl-CoA C-acetyltransferase
VINRIESRKDHSLTLIFSACRTPVGKFLGGLSTLSAAELGALAVRESMARAGVAPGRVNEVIMGNVLPAGVGQAPARQAALKAGIPPAVSALTVNMVCGSGLRAVMLADQAIRVGDAECIVAGGMESMSRAPFLIEGARTGLKFGDQTLVDHMQKDGLTCAFDRLAMGLHAEHTARTCSVSREDQDGFAVESQRRAAAAQAAGWFKDEILPVDVTVGKKTSRIDADEGIRADTTLDGLAKLRPAFDPSGSVTAGNASTLSDGAAAVLLGSEEFAESTGTRPIARVVCAAVAGTEPRDLFIAPVPAITRALEKAGLTVPQIDLFEINEAFASQTLACARPLKIPADRLNVAGGAIAIGHPIGASGARVLVTLVHGLIRTGGRYGVAALCLGGGNAVAVIVERV